MRRINLTVSEGTYNRLEAYAKQMGIKSVAGAVQFLALNALNIEERGGLIRIALIEELPEWGGQRENAGRKRKD